MSHRNPLREDERAREQMDGKHFISLRTHRINRILGVDGNAIDIPVEVYDSRPAEDGTYVETIVTNLPIDAAGNVFPRDPNQFQGYSNSALYITSPEQKAVCTSWLHPSGLSKNICLPYDGRPTISGAICNRCRFWLTTIRVLLGIVAVGVVLGIWSGAGVF
jgi:hypothetical protein